MMELGPRPENPTVRPQRDRLVAENAAQPAQPHKRKTLMLSGNACRGVGHVVLHLRFW